MGFIEQIGTAGLIIIAILAILFNAFLIYSRSKRIRQALETAKKEQIALEKAKADLTKNPNQVQELEQEESLR